jgi:hypothetical protein
MSKKNFVYLNLKHYFPGIMSIADQINMDWDNIDKLFSKEIERRKVEWTKGNTIIEASIYDIIVEVKKGNKSAVGLLDFFNKLFLELSGRLPLDENKLIKRNIRSVLTALNKEYLHFIGELAVLNNVLKSGSYILTGVEYQLENKRSIDFNLKRTANGGRTLVEVYNIHLDEEKVSNEAEAISKFLNKRLTKKIAEKKANLTTDVEFFLVPVLWAGVESLRVYSEYFKTHKMSINNVIEPVAYVTFSDGEGYYVHNFGNISNVLNLPAKSSKPV